MQNYAQLDHALFPKCSQMVPIAPKTPIVMERVASSKALLFRVSIVVIIPITLIACGQTVRACVTKQITFVGAHTRHGFQVLFRDGSQGWEINPILNSYVEVCQ